LKFLGNNPTTKYFQTLIKLDIIAICFATTEQ
jgi:hypothetical protein